MTRRTASGCTGTCSSMGWKSKDAWQSRPRTITTLSTSAFALDYVLAQDMIAWWAQGEIVDRSRERLGRTDVPIILLRRQLDEQIRIVEQGGDPMNFFQEEPDDILYGSGSPPEGWTSPDWAKQQLSMRQGYRTMYHKGFVLDDADRYGPVVPLVQELHRRIEAAQEATLRG